MQSLLKLTILAAVSCWFLLIPNRAIAQKKAERQLEKQLSEIREKANALKEKLKVPGVALAIVKEGEVVFSEGFGQRDVNNDLPVDQNTIFAIGSASKAFATASLAQLVDEGSVSWSERVKVYLPDFELKDEVATREMTLLDLMTHRSGLPRHDFSWIGTSEDREGLYQRLRYLDFSTSFRGSWQYQNLLYTTGGYLAGKVAGKTWEQLVQEQLFVPLKMTHTTTAIAEMLSQENITKPYMLKEQELIEVDHESYDAIAPAGGVNSNLTDMAKWVKLHLKDSSLLAEDIISASQIDFMHAPQAILSARRPYTELSHKSYGLGWFVYYNRGHKVVEHGGNVTGYTSLVYLLPDDDIGMVILTNLNTTALPGLLALYATDVLLGNDEVDWYERIIGKEDKEDKGEEEPEEKEDAKRVENTSPNHNLVDYQGIYTNPGYGRVDVNLKSDSLTVTYNGKDYVLEHWHFDVFRGEDKFHGIKRFFNFITATDGELSHLEIAFEPTVDPIQFKKQPPNTMNSPEYLKALVGEYLVEKVQKAKVEFKDKNTLQLVIEGQTPYELVPYKQDQFELKPLKGFSVKFEFDDEGKPEALIFYQPNGTFRAERQN